MVPVMIGTGMHKEFNRRCVCVSQPAHHGHPSQEISLPASLPRGKWLLSSVVCFNSISGS